MKLSILPILALVIAPSIASAGLPGFVPQPIEQEQQSTEYYITYNGVNCVTSPCPSFTALSVDGEKFELANVELPEASFGFYEIGTGLSVTGNIIEGDWSMGGKGDVLVVETVKAATSTFLLQKISAQCLVAPCPEFTVVTALNGIKHYGVDINVDLLSGIYDAESVVDGDVAVNGFLSEVETEAGTQKTLYVTAFNPIVDATLSHSGIVCVTTPCQMWEASETDGNKTLLTGIKLHLLNIAPEERAAALDDILDGTAVRGIFVASSDPLTTLPTLVFFVTSVDKSEGLLAL